MVTEEIYTETRFFQWIPDERCVTLREHGCSYGGGQRGTYCAEVIGLLCFDDYKCPNRQYVDDGKLIIRKEKT